MGTAVALPFLDAMVPGIGRRRRAPPSRPCAWRLSMCPTASSWSSWNPDYEGKLAELPRILKPLEPYKDDILLLGNLTHNTGRALLDGAGDHGRCCGIVPHRHPGQEEHDGYQGRRLHGPDRGAGRSADQTRFPSLEVGLEDARQSGDCDSGYSCAYTNNLAWRSETQPLPPILDPRALFERLFGNGAVLSPEARVRQANYRRSILDFVTEDTRKLETGLGPTDRRKLDEYLSSIREVERQIEKRREGQRADRSAHGEALRRAGRFRRALQADDRHDHHRVPGGPDARGHLPGDARRHLAAPIARSASPTATIRSPTTAISPT